jgi:hypothetical protein
MTRPPTQLDPKLTWDDDGCLSDCGIAALADGEQAIVPGAEEHVRTCEYCHVKLGEAVMCALELAQAIEALPSGALLAGTASSSRPVHIPARSLPWRALTCAVLVAVLSITPGLESFLTHITALPTSHGQAFALLARCIARMGAIAAWLTGQRTLELAATVLFAACGVLIARLAPRHVQRPGAA